MVEIVQFSLPGAGWTTQLSPAAISVMNRRRQILPWSKEVAGQLYCDNLMEKRIVVGEASVLKAKRSFARVTFDTDLALRERAKAFERGLHCVGIWHTHPERHPSPSSVDLALAEDYARAARTMLSGILFVIVGITGSARDWFVGVHDGSQMRRAHRLHD